MQESVASPGTADHGRNDAAPRSSPTCSPDLVGGPAERVGHDDVGTRAEHVVGGKLQTAERRDRLSGCGEGGRGTSAQEGCGEQDDGGGTDGAHGMDLVLVGATRSGVAVGEDESGGR